MAFQEGKHRREHGRFSSKEGSDGSAKDGGGESKGRVDLHSDRVSDAVRKSETERLRDLLGPNPTPEEERQVLRGEADKLTDRAKSLMQAIRASRKAEEAQAHGRGERRKEEARQNLAKENAERSKKGLPPKKPRKDEPSSKSSGGSSKGGGSGKGGGSTKDSDAGPSRGKREQLDVTYQRLVVVRDVAFRRGVEL